VPKDVPREIVDAVLGSAELFVVALVEAPAAAALRTLVYVGMVYYVAKGLFCGIFFYMYCRMRGLERSNVRLRFASFHLLALILLRSTCYRSAYGYDVFLSQTRAS